MSAVTLSAREAPVPPPAIIADDKPPIAGWALAALCVVALHAVIAYVIFHHQDEAAPGAETPPAVMVDLAPLSVAPPAEQDLDLPPAPEKMEEAPPEEVKPPEPEVKPPEPEPQPTMVDPPKDVVVPEAPLAPKPEVVLEAPKPPPPPPPTPEPEKKKVEKVVKKEHKPKAVKTAAPKRTDAAPSHDTAAPSSEMGHPSLSPANWQSLVSSRLNSVKRCPSGGSGSGTATVAFSISGGGGVGGGRLVHSSGNSALDSEAVGMVHRAAPYPPTPSGGTVSLTVPIHFGCGG